MGGRVALAVWDEPAVNAWATIPTRALVELGHSAPPDPNAPGMFALAAPGRLQELLEAAGFLDVLVETVDPSRSHVSVEEYVAETNDLSSVFHETWQALSDVQRQEVVAKIAELAQPYAAADGSLMLSGRSLVAAADA